MLSVLSLLLLDVSLVNINCFMYFRPAPPIKNVRGQIRKNEVTKPNARPQRTTNVGKKPDPKTNKKDEKPKPVKKEEKKEDNKVRLACAVCSGTLRSEVKYRVIHKSLRDFRTRLRNNQDRHSRKEHINR